MSAIALALPLGLAGCLPSFKDAPPPPAPPPNQPPEWFGLTVNFSSAPVSGLWVTTVTVPGCFDPDGDSTSTFATVSNGSLQSTVGGGAGGDVFIWFRAPGAVFGTALAGDFTANCIDDTSGLQAHPTLAVTADALP